MLTKNSAKYLAIVLENLSLFDEVVILDNGSTDDTLAIAGKFDNVVIYEHAFIGFGPMKNLAASYARNNWVLTIDSDEVISNQLAENILSLDLSSNCVYQFLRLNYYQHRLVNASSWANDWVRRLYNKQVTSYDPVEVHESIQINKLSLQNIDIGVLHHLSFSNIASLITKGQHYSDLFVSKNPDKKVSIVKIISSGFGYLFKNLIIKKGLFSGFDAFIIALNNSFFGMMRYAKLYEYQRYKLVAVVLELSDINKIELLLDMVNSFDYIPDFIVVKCDESIQLNTSKLLYARMLAPYVVVSQIPNLDKYTVKIINY